MKPALSSTNGRPTPAVESGILLRTGFGECIAQYGEIFQGQIEDANHQLRRCLLSLPCPPLFSKTTFAPVPHGPLVISPPHKLKAKKALQMTLTYLGASAIGGNITMESNIPESKGCGSSTADCVAAVIAAADALGHALAEEEVAHLVVKAEIASDNIMFKNAVLFAHREGVVLEDYVKKTPVLEILGVDTEKDGFVHTLDFPLAIYSREQQESFQRLAGALRKAIFENDLELLGKVATESACINDLFLPKPMLSEIRRLADDNGALGIAVAHSGTVLSILMDPAHPLLERRMESIQNGLVCLGISNWLRYRT